MIVVLKDGTFGQNVFFNRILQGMEQNDFARKVGISKGELECIESGLQLSIEEHTMIAISDALQISLKDLLDE